MDHKRLDTRSPRHKPRIIIHGGAGNLKPSTLTPEQWKQYRHSLITIICKTNAYMTSPISGTSSHCLPTALQTATYAVSLFEDDPLFNSGHGAVFTRDGINELEASIMVSRGHKKRGVGVSGIRTVKNPIKLAKAMLDAGEDDMEAAAAARSSSDGNHHHDDVPSAQGHTHLHGQAVTTALAEKYGLDLVRPEYYFTQRRWDEHVRALEREKKRDGGGSMATWSKDEFLPQGTVGAVALDEDGVVCVATSTGGITNKLSGRIGDTPTVGAGFWAGEWEEGESQIRKVFGSHPESSSWAAGAGIKLSDGLSSLLGDCLPSPGNFIPLSSAGVPGGEAPVSMTRSFAASGTGNGDSFLRIGAARTAAARAQYRPEPSSEAVTAVAGPLGDLQLSAGDRWGKTGEGEGGMIGIEAIVGLNEHGEVIGTKSEILQDFNCGGMFRAWIDDQAKVHARVWREGHTQADQYEGHNDEGEDIRDRVVEKW